MQYDCFNAGASAKVSASHVSPQAPAPLVSGNNTLQGGSDVYLGSRCNEKSPQSTMRVEVSTLALTTPTQDAVRLQRDQRAGSGLESPNIEPLRQDENLSPFSKNDYFVEDGKSQDTLNQRLEAAKSLSEAGISRKAIMTSYFWLEYEAQSSELGTVPDLVTHYEELSKQYRKKGASDIALCCEELMELNGRAIKDTASSYLDLLLKRFAAALDVDDAPKDTYMKMIMETANGADLSFSGLEDVLKNAWIKAKIRSEKSNTCLRFYWQMMMEAVNHAKLDLSSLTNILIVEHEDAFIFGQSARARACVKLYRKMVHVNTSPDNLMLYNFRPILIEEYKQAIANRNTVWAKFVLDGIRQIDIYIQKNSPERLILIDEFGAPVLRSSDPS